MSYADLALLKHRLGGQFPTTTQDAILQLSLDWGDQFINDYTHRFFAARRETRYFAPDALDPDVDPLSPRYVGISGGSHANIMGLDWRAYRRLYVDQDLLSIYSVTNGDGTLIPGDGYWAEPRNEKPHYAVTLTATYAWSWGSDGWVTIDADWGYSTTPSAVIQGFSLRLAEFHYRSRAPQVKQQPLWEGTFKGSQMPEGFPMDVVKGLDPLVRLAR